TDRDGNTSAARISVQIDSSGMARPAAIATAPWALGFSIQPGTGQLPPRVLHISTGSDPTLGWSASGNHPWIGLSSASGAGPADLSVAVDVTGLAPGSYQGVVSVTGAGGTQSTLLFLDITGPAQASSTTRIYIPAARR